MLCALIAAGVSLAAQRPNMSGAVKRYVNVDAPIVALTNARVIDGTGAPARDGQTIIIQDDKIAAVGDGKSTSIPAGATTVDLTGKTVLPGLVMLHEHLFYPTGPEVYGQLGESFTRLYLAGGVTTMRTGGNLNGFMDLNLRRLIESGAKPGPAIDATAPYVNGPSLFMQIHAVNTPEEARRHVAYWVDAGATSVKAYTDITRGVLAAAIDEAHKRGIKVTAHLCSVSYAEAADLGIDDLEHGFFASTDFVADKKPDVCPGIESRVASFAGLDESSVPFTALVKKLVDKHVALTSTLPVFEVSVPGRPMPPGLDVLTPQLKQQFEQTFARTAQGKDSPGVKLFPKFMAFERAFAKAGGLLLAGTDPTGSGGVIPGYANHRQIELLVEAGFSPVEAISIGTLNGAKYLGRDARIGTIAKGKQADLVVVNGNPAVTIADIRHVEMVFKQGIGFDPSTLIESVRGRVGLW
jgi:imidazolonepropionase-like amidohydrolase